MKPVLLYLCVSLILLTSVFSFGLGAPPNKFFVQEIGKNLTLIIQIINEEGKPGTYTISLEGSLKDRAIASPSTLLIYPTHKGGIENSVINIDSTGILPGTYNLKIVAELKDDGSDLNIIQQITRTITVEYRYPPSFFNRVANFFFIGVGKLFNSMIGFIVNIYRSNPWLNYLFVMILVTVFFYVGTKMTEIKDWLKQLGKKLALEMDKMEKRGFGTWIKDKIGDRFKKHKGKENIDGHKKGIV